MTVDIVEELRAELRNCLFTAAQRKALEAELAELIRWRNEASRSSDEETVLDQPFSSAGA